MKAIRLSSSLATRTLGRSQTRLVRLAKTPINFSSIHTSRVTVGSRFGSAALGFAGVALGLFYYASTAHAEDKEEKESVPAPTEEQNTQPQDDELTIVKYKYVIIGAGTAGHAALAAILQNDPQAKVLVLSAEHHLPYSRPPLTKDLWNSEDPNVAVNLKFKNWEGTESNVWYEGVDYKNDPRVVFATMKAIDLDPFRHRVLLEDETVAEYEKCLIATGGDPRVLPAGKGLDRVSTFRTLDDFRQMDQVARHAEHIVIVGGGFLGSELAWGISKKGVKVTQVFPEKGVLAATFPDYLAEYATNVGRKAGIEYHTETLVNNITPNEKGVTVTLDNGHTLNADHVVMAAGIVPSNQLAVAGELEIDTNNGGILVNPELQARSDLYVAGDVASYFDVTLGVRRRVEHHDHAVSSGKLAGENMTGASKPYYYLPFFWSDVGPIGFEAVGVVDSRLDKVAVWQKEEGQEVGPNPDYKRGIVYYLKDSKVVGVLLLGVYGKVDAARAVIKRKQHISNFDSLKRAISLEEEHHEKMIYLYKK